MNITERRLLGLTIFEVSGKVTIGVGDVRVRDAVHTALATGIDRIVLNLNNVTALDSSGVGEIMAAHNAVTRRGGRFALARLPTRVAGILQATLLAGIVEIYDTEDDAVAALES